MGIGLVVGLVRFALGIGAISNLSNTFPWGFWISFDIYTGIAISSGAFLLAAAVYIFNLQQFRPLVMPSILTALIGYFMEVLALMVDLGRPERIFNMLFYQNYTSWMLVVGLCVMIYLGILALEFAPVFFKGIQKEKWAVVTRRFIKPAVILGVVVSTIHQGSLGALMLIQSAKLHPLWWTPLLPVMFLVSAISIGLAMIIFESSLSSRYFKRGLEIHLLERLARAIPFALGFYAFLKFGQLLLDGKSSFLFSSGQESLLFWAEIIVGVLVPVIIFANPRNRTNPRALLTGAIMLLLGMILNRFNVSWIGIQRLQDVPYVPSLMELSISAAIFSFGIMAFGLAARYLPLFEDAEQHTATT
jgi:Ni/Fe-hydrogenase subunit HybB-like protein